jgi:hypothetical protein
MGLVIKKWAEELLHKMSFAALEAYIAGKICGWLYGNGANGDSYKELLAAFSAGMLHGAESAAQGTSLTVDDLAQMMGVSRSGFYALLQKVQERQPLLERKETVLAFEILAELEAASRSAHNGVDLTWLQDKFVNYEEDEQESETAYNKRIAAEETRVKNIVEQLYKYDKIEKRSRRDGSVRYYVTNIAVRPDDPAAFETALKDIKKIIGTLTIAALEQHHWGEKNGASIRYASLQLQDDPAAREVLKKARGYFQEFTANMEKLNEWYLHHRDLNAKELVTLNVVGGRVVDYSDNLSDDELSEISNIIHD